MILTDVIGGSMFDFAPNLPLRFLHEYYAIHVVCKEKLILRLRISIFGFHRATPNLYFSQKKKHPVWMPIYYSSLPYLLRICEALDCDITDSMELVRE